MCLQLGSRPLVHTFIAVLITSRQHSILQPLPGPVRCVLRLVSCGGFACVSPSAPCHRPMDEEWLGSFLGASPSPWLSCPSAPSSTSMQPWPPPQAPSPTQCSTPRPCPLPLRTAFMAPLITLGMYAAPMDVCHKVYRAKSTGTFVLLPYLTMQLCCALWARYGFQLGICHPCPCNTPVRRTPPPLPSYQCCLIYRKSRNNDKYRDRSTCRTQRKQPSHASV